MNRLHAAGTLLIAALCAQQVSAQVLDKPPPVIEPGGAVSLAPSYVPDTEQLDPHDRAQVRRDWEQMAREWEARQRAGAYSPSMPTGANPYASRSFDPPPSPQDPIDTRRAWAEMTREWEARQRDLAR